MPKYLIMVEGANSWQEIERPQKDFKTVYCLECSFISPKTRIAIRNEETKETRIFTRRLDSNGNLLEVLEV